MNAATFKTRFPEFNNLSDEVIEVNITNAKDITSESFWGKYYEQAIGLLTAHEISIRQDDVLKRQYLIGTVDKVKSYPSTSENYYAQSSYGVKFAQLRKKIAISGFTY